MGNCCLYSQVDLIHRSSLNVVPRFEICIKSSRKVSSNDHHNFNNYGIIREELEEEEVLSPYCCNKFQQSYSTSHLSNNIVNLKQPFKLQNTFTQEYLSENLSDKWIFQFEQENIVKLYDPILQLYYCNSALYELNCEDEYICYNSVVKLTCKENNEIQGTLNLSCDQYWRIIEMQ